MNIYKVMEMVGNIWRILIYSEKKINETKTVFRLINAVFFLKIIYYFTLTTNFC